MIQELTTSQRVVEMVTFRSRLRPLMLKHSLEVGKQLSQSEVARESGVSLATVQRWYDPEYTFNRVDAETLGGLLDYFGCKFEDLVEIITVEAK